MTIPTDGRIDLDALAELAKAATPGPWKVYDGSSWRRIGTVGARYDDGAVLQPYVASDGHPDMCAGRGQDTYANLNYIAALDPQTVLALIDLARRTEAKADDRPDPTPDAAFAAWVASLPKESWAKYDLSACRLGWDAARRAAIPSEQGEAVAWDCADDAGIFCTTHVKTAAENIAAKGYTVTPLYHHPAPAAGVRVTALEWRELTSPREDGPAEPNGEWEALCVFGAYSIDFATDDDVAKPQSRRGKRPTRTRSRISPPNPFCVWTPVDSLGHFASADDAKAAAQADYEARILSALDQGEPK